MTDPPHDPRRVSVDTYWHYYECCGGSWISVTAENDTATANAELVRHCSGLAG